MARPPVNLGGGPALLDVGSYARRGPARRDRLSSAQIELIARTVHRAPEVMVKVLTRGGQSVLSVARHLSYLNRAGKVDLETDDGLVLKGRDAAKAVVDDWDLDLDELRPTADLKPRGVRRPPKLVHKLMFSMPPGTPPEKVLAAVKNLTREEFALKHRYAMVLHTDEPHPHVHVVVKAMGDDGRRLNIRKATLRHWRREFARHLRELGVAANATERAARGVTRPQKPDSIFRAAERDASTHWRARRDAVARELAKGGLQVEPAKAQLLETRRAVVRGWRAVAEDLDHQNEADLAEAVRRFLDGMAAPKTEKEWIAQTLIDESNAKKRELTR